MPFFPFFKKRKTIQKPAFSFKMLFWVLFAVTLHIILFKHYENVSYFDALWVTLTTLFTVGYGDLFAKTVEGRTATMLLLYGGGIFIIAKVTGDWFEFLSTKLNKKLKGMWRYKMKNHIVIINHPENNPTLFIKGLISDLEKDSHFQDRDIVVVSSLDEMPTALADLKWVHGSINDMDTLNNADVQHADAIFVLANSAIDSSFDSFALDIVDNLRNNNCKAYIIAECVKVENKPRLIKNGADAVIKVIHGYPSVAARALTAKGSQEVLENLFSEDNEECIRINIGNPMTKTWTDMVIYCLTKGIGTPIACIDSSNQILTSPLGKTVTAHSLFVIATCASGKNSIDMNWS